MRPLSRPVSNGNNHKIFVSGGSLSPKPKVIGIFRLPILLFP